MGSFISHFFLWKICMGIHEIRNSLIITYQTFLALVHYSKAFT